MKVNFYATLRQITGQKTVEFEFQEGVTVDELVDSVVTRYPEMRDALFDDDGELYPYVHVFVNGRDAPYLDEGLATELSLSDKVDIFPAAGGG